MAGFSDDVEVIRALYATADPATGEWTRFLTRLAARTRADAASLQIDQADAAFGWHAGTPLSLPAPGVQRRMRQGRVYARDDLPGDGLPAPADALRALRLSWAGDGHLTLMISRRSGEFRAAEAAVLDRLAPHLEQAAQTWLRLHALRAATERTARIARAMGCGWLVFDDTAKVVEADPVARSTFEAAGMPLTTDGRISADSRVSRTLRLAVEAALADASPASVLTLTHAPLRQLALMPEGPHHALGLLRAAPLAQDLPPGSLAAALGLTRSEGRLAACLADGDSLATAALRLGWQIETTRSTSKQIYARLGIDGQSALLRMILTSALWLTPH